MDVPALRNGVIPAAGDRKLGNPDGPGAIATWAGGAITRFTGTSPYLAGATVVSLIALGWLGIYLGGGTTYVPSHWFYIPIILAAIRFGLKGAVGTALISALVAGPLLPADVAAGVQQSLSKGSFRAFYFVLIGVFMAAVIVRLQDLLAKESELARHEAELAAHQAALISTVSHEFRSPLSVLLTTSKMLAGAEGSGFDPTIVDGITSSARRLNDLVTAVLAVSEGPLAAEPKAHEVPLRSVVEGVREGLEVSMRNRVSFDVADVIVRTNPAILEGLLHQLVENALKFSPEGSSVEIRTWESEPDVLFIGVSDRGAGIDEAFLPRAFDAFTQQDESMTRSVGGLGIGLFVAFRLAQCLRAEVDLRPRDGGGTEAVVKMPGGVVSPEPVGSSVG